MIVNEAITGFVAIIIAYLLGSIPAAYIVTRLATGKDIRRLGSGNVGGNNVYRHAGLRAAIPVVIFDVGKGTAAVAIAHWLLDAPLYEPHLFVLLSGIAVVAGHMWSVYLIFAGVIFSILTAQTLYSGILDTGSRAELVSRLAALSAK